MKIKIAGYVILALAIILTSVMPVVYKIGSNFNPIELAWLVSVVGVAGSLVIMFAKKTQGNLKEYLKSRRSIFPFAFVGIAEAAQTLIFSYTTHFISASLLAVIYRSWPLLFILITPFAFKEKITKYDALAVLIGFSGMAVALLGGTVISLPIVLVPFAALVFLAAVMDAWVGVFEKGYKYEMTSTLFLYNLFFFITTSLFMVYPSAPINLNLGLSDVSVILFLGIFQNILLTFFFTSAFRMNRSSLVANASMIVPFITIALDYGLLGEPLQISTLAIAVSVLAGLLIQKFAPRTTNYLSKSKLSGSAPLLFDVTSVFVNTKNELLYNVIKGDGRALAFCIKSKNEEVLKRCFLAIDEMKGDNYLITTNKSDSPELDPSELEFIKDITGQKPDDLIILGFGKPDIVEDKLTMLHVKVFSSSYSIDAPSVVS